jgi:hypothetical protein
MAQAHFEAIDAEVISEIERSCLDAVGKSLPIDVAVGVAVGVAPISV